MSISYVIKFITHTKKFHAEIMSMSALEEQLRESACYGDEDALTSLLQSGVNVNSANAMNGWTALHWACKVRMLLFIHSGIQYI